VGEKMDEQATTALEDAVATFQEEGPKHKNCAQSVMLFALAALRDADRDVSVARYLGGGIAMSGSTCGALTGAALALAVRDRLRHGPDWGDDVASDTRSELRALMTEFAVRFGSASCHELTACDFTTPDGYRRFRDDRLYENCATYVRWVCEQLAETL
jgi:C_GCAxxG_C_C family probable redox protein